MYRVSQPGASGLPTSPVSRSIVHVGRVAKRHLMHCLRPHRPCRSVLCVLGATSRFLQPVSVLLRAGLSRLSDNTVRLMTPLIAVQIGTHPTAVQIVPLGERRKWAASLGGQKGSLTLRPQPVKVD